MWKNMKPTKCFWNRQTRLHQINLLCHLSHMGTKKEVSAEPERNLEMNKWGRECRGVWGEHALTVQRIVCMFCKHILVSLKTPGRWDFWINWHNATIVISKIKSTCTKELQPFSYFISNTFREVCVPNFMLLFFLWKTMYQFPKGNPIKYYWNKMNI